MKISRATAAQTGSEDATGNNALMKTSKNSLNFLLVSAYALDVRAWIRNSSFSEVMVGCWRRLLQNGGKLDMYKILTTWLAMYRSHACYTALPVVGPCWLYMCGIWARWATTCIERAQHVAMYWKQCPGERVLFQAWTHTCIYTACMYTVTHVRTCTHTCTRSYDCHIYFNSCSILLGWELVYEEHLLVH